MSAIPMRPILQQAAPQHDSPEYPGQDGKDDHRWLEGDECDEHYAGTPAATPSLRGSGPAQQ